MFSSFLTYNIEFGMLESYVHGLRASLLTTEDYNNLCQCETLEDMKLHLSGTDYGNFLQNEPSPLNPSVITEKAREKLVKEINEIRFQAVEPLSRFIDYITYKYMIVNVLKLIQALSQGRQATSLLVKCHPLGNFEKLNVLFKLENFVDMYDIVLFDSPIGKFFSKTGLSEKDFGEFSVILIQSMLYKNYLESFYDFCRNLGGITSEVMSEILEFEADLITLTIIRQVAKASKSSKDLKGEIKSLLPNFGSLNDIQDKLLKIEGDNQIKELLKGKYSEYYDMFLQMENNDGLSLEMLSFRKQVDMNKYCFTRQFHFGIFFSIIKLKEQEIRNLMWIAECIHQNMRGRIHEFVPIYSESGYKVK